MEKQTTALSTVEAENFSMYHAVKDALWFENVLQEILDKHFWSIPQDIFIDNQVVVSLANNQTTSEHNKHIELRHFFLHEKIEEKLLSFTYVSSKLNVSHMLTKSVNQDINAKS